MPRLTRLFWLCLLLLGALPALAQGGDIAITVYNEGTALIRETRTLTLEAGMNRVEISDVAATIDPSSVSIGARGSSGLRVMEQSYNARLVDRDALLAHFTGEVISVTAADGAVYSGELLYGAGDDIILRGEGESIVMPNLSQALDIGFPALPDSLLTRPALQWLLDSEEAGEHVVELTYLAGGLNWTADYNLLLNADESAFDITGWITLVNRSGRGYTEAQLKLVAGDINRVDAQARLGSQHRDGDGPGGARRRRRGAARFLRLSTLRDRADRGYQRQINEAVRVRHGKRRPGDDTERIRCVAGLRRLLLAG